MRLNYKLLHFIFAIFVYVNGFAKQRIGRKCHKHQRQNHKLGNYSSAAVTIDGKPCAKVGMDVLLEGGSAVDAAIAAMFCNGIQVCHSMGIGGGMIMTVYKRCTRKVETLIARERAPKAATEDMFHGDANLSQKGGLSIAIPGQILGLYEAKSKYGNPAISWARLIQPSINMCRNGVTVSPDLAIALKGRKEDILLDPGMSEVFVDSSTGDVYQEGDVFLWPKLADTLQRIADNGASDFYTGETARLMLEDIQKVGSILTLEDLKNYRTQWQPSLNISLGNNLVLHSVHPPAGGAILAFILNILKNYKLNPKSLNPLLFHRLTEIFKWAYAIRSKLGDPSDPKITPIINEIIRNVTSDDYTYEIFKKINDNFTVNDPKFYGADFYQPGEDEGTTHMGVVAANGDAVAITSTINHDFGSVVLSPQTGVIMNNEMDDFSSPNITSGFQVPPSPNNFIRPGKIPLSSTCPTIIIDKKSGEVRFVTGGSGGTKITTQVVWTAMRNLWLGQNLKIASDAPRIHHQLIPMEILYEENIEKSILDELRRKGHVLKLENNIAVVNSISKEKDGRLYAHADKRKDGATAGY